MKKKFLISLMAVFSLFLITGCGNEEKKEEKKEETKQETKTSKKVTTNQQLGDLSYFIPTSLRLNGTSTENVKIFELTNDTTNLTVWVIRKSDIEDDLMTYLETDPWEVDTSSLDKVTYNDYEWYVQPRGTFMLFTKYNNDVYKIRFSVLEDKENYISELKKTIPPSLIFNKEN